ncbi:multidrug effflux MFS transporter [Muricoccus radiodurans]|uniref:multidrug effflux MFS transporter n=1 Tax=Muricoccus radiodurans TaxID=2231721 RepID=UPI003CEBD8B9
MPSWLPLLLGFLTAINPISTDMYLPAFPAIEAQFAGTVQVTLASWFVGLAIGQLVQGTLSDRFGRRGPLIVGTLIYTGASVGCALANDMTTLAVFRFLAAIGASASSVIPRAVVRDLVTGLEATRIMSRLILVMGAAPILAPSLGSLVLGFAGWRTIFWVMSAYGALSCALVWWLLPDTLPVERRVQHGAAALLSGFGRVIVERAFITHALMGAAMMFCIFAYVSGTPGVLIGRYGLSTTSFAVLFGLGSCSFIGGAQFNPMLVRRFGQGRVLTAAALGGVAATGLLVVAAITGLGGLWTLFPPVMATLACASLIMPNSAVGALHRHGARAGTASALMGTIQFSVAAVASLLVGALNDGTAWPMAVVMLLGALMALAMDRLRPRQL